MPSLQDAATVVSLLIGIGGFLFGLYQWHVSRKDRITTITVELKIEDAPAVSAERFTLHWYIASDKHVKVNRVGLVAVKGLLRKSYGMFFIPSINQERVYTFTRPFDLTPLERKHLDHYFNEVIIVMMQFLKLKGKFELRGAVEDGQGKIHIGRTGLAMRVTRDGKLIQHPLPE